jgi:hypothetical protein
MPVTDPAGQGADAGGVAGAGDEAVADEIVDLQPRLYRFARSLTGDPEEASDLAKETFARALVRSPAGTAVVAGDALAPTLWSVTARLQGSRDVAAQAVLL